jgi:transposase
MEAIKGQIGDTTLILTDEGMTITIPRGYWTKRQWNWLVQLVTQLVVTGLAWVTAPSTISAVPSTLDNPPVRWKRMSIDALSYLLYALMIPINHPLRTLYEAIDWSTIDQLCASVYKNQVKGAPAYPPQVLFRILVLMFYSGTPFESATLRRLETDVAWRWFVGLSLLWRIPNAATLSYFRERLGVALFEAILIELIRACDEAGLIDHLESYYDMTGVEASATQVSPYQRAVILAKAMGAYLDQEPGGIGVISQEQIAAIALEVLQEQHPSLNKVKPGQIVSSQTKLDQKLAQTVKGEPHWWQRLQQQFSQLGDRLRETPQATVEYCRQLAGELIPTLPQAFGNPDAAVGHTRTDGTVCGYRSGFLVDAKHWIITAVVFVALNQPEAPTAITALDKHYAIFQRYPKRLGVDSAFDRDEVHRGTQTRHIEGVATVRSRPGPKGLFHADAFVWNEQGELICPGQEVMEKVAGPYKDGTDRYRAQAECAACPLFEQCLTAKQRQQEEPRRALKTNTTAHQRAQQNRARSRSDAGWALRLRRFAAEGLFGHVNRYHNGDKAPYRDGAMDHIAQLMVAFTSNLEKLAAHAPA